MTLDDILKDETLRQSEFPVARNRIFLAHAGDCPLPARAAEAIRTYAAAATLDDQEKPIFPQLLAETRVSASRLLGVGSDEVAMVGPTSLGLNLVASGFPFRRGDNIVVYFDDYPSNVYPWMALADRGVTVRFLHARAWGRVAPLDILEQIDEETRLVAMSSCHFITGWRLDYADLAKRLDERGIAFCLDGIQTIGAFPTPLKHVAFMAADAHKWMLGPCGAGLFYVRKDWQERLKPTILGWNNVRCPGFVAREKLEFRTGAHRYEAGSYNWMGMAGMKASMDLLNEVGVEAIGRELIRKRGILAQGLVKLGLDVVEPDMGPKNASGIVSFRDGSRPLAPLHAALAERGIITSLRENRAGIEWIRLSPHFYNTDAELNRFLEVIQELRTSAS